MTSLSLFTFMHWRRECQPTPVFLTGEFHGQRCLAGYSPWGCKKLDMAEQLTLLKRLIRQMKSRKYRILQKISLTLSLLNDGTNSNYFVLEKLHFMLSPTLCCYHYCFCLSSFQAHDGNAMSYHVCCSVWPCQRRQWHPTPVLLPGKSHGWRSLVGCSPWGHQESDTTK